MPSYRMKSYELRFRSKMSSSLIDAFAYLQRPSTFQRLIPPWRKIKFLSQENDLYTLWVFHQKWVLSRKVDASVHLIEERQVKGPFKTWEHFEQLRSEGPTSCQIEDRIEFCRFFPFSSFKIAEQVAKVFSWRQDLMARDLWLNNQYPTKPMRILLSGSSGFIGTSLLLFLRSLGHEVVRLVRSGPASDAILWNPQTSEADKEQFENFDAVIHLAGENVAGRWSEKKKDAILVSRVRDTWVLSQILSRLNHPPKTFICASAVGFYGDRGEEILTEESPKGNGFLSDAAAKWESSTQSAEAHGIRVVHTRFGAVLSPSGGMLKNMMPVFRLYLGGKFGSGKQIMSWIAIDDLLGAIYHILNSEKISGAVNFTAPHPVSQEEFAKTLAEMLGKRCFLTYPSSLLRGTLGQMAEELLLSSQKALPNRLIETGYSFAFPTLNKALKFWL